MAVKIFQICVGLWFVSIIYVYKRFSVLCYGTIPLGIQDIMDLRWRESWDFIVHRP